MDGRYLFGMLLAEMGIYSPMPIRFGRLVVALSAVVGCAVALGLGSQLGSRAGGLLAGLLYALLPYTVFHERQVLADPVMANVGSLVLLFTLWAGRSGRWMLAVLTALALSAAFLFKPSGLVYAGIPVLAVLVLNGQRHSWRRRLGHSALTLSLTVIGTLAFLGAYYPRLGVNDNRLATQSLGFIQCPPLVCRGDWAEQWRQLHNVVPPLPELLDVYFGWPVLALAVAAWPVSRSFERRPVLLVLSFVLSAGAFFLLGGRDELVPRYLSPLAAPLAALSAHGTVALLRRTATPTARLALTIPLLLAVFWSLPNTVTLIMRPEQARVPAFDRHQYFTGSVSGTAFQMAALAIAAQDAQPVVITRHFMRYALAAFFDPRLARVLNPWEVRWGEVKARLTEGAAIYLVDEVPWETPPIANGQRIDLYPYLQNESRIRVRQVSASDPQALAELYHFVFPAPEEFRGDYEKLKQALATQTEVATVVTYPPSQLDLLAGLLADTPSLHPTPIGGPRPWEPQSAIEAWPETAGNPLRLHVIFLDEARLDPGRQVEAWLNTRFFRLAEQWVGPLRWATYAGESEASPQITTIEARFGEGFELVHLESLDQRVPPGGVVRLRLTWRVATQLLRPQKVFIHVFDSARLLAQHDGQPVGELRPTSTWQVGDEIVDQFAIRLPPNAPSGIYQFRIGLYDLETQARLPVRFADGTLAEYWEGGQLSVP